MLKINSCTQEYLLLISEINSKLTLTTSVCLEYWNNLLTNFKDIKEDENESEEIGIEALESTQDQEASKAHLNFPAKVEYKDEDNFEGGEDETSV